MFRQGCGRKVGQRRMERWKEDGEGERGGVGGATKEEDRKEKGAVEGGRPKEDRATEDWAVEEEEGEGEG